MKRQSVGVAMALLMLSPLLHAQSVGMPEALKGVQAAGSMCLKEGAAAAVKGAASGARALAEVQPDLSCLLPVPALTLKEKDPDLALLDVRPMQAGDQPEAPGALGTMRMEASAIASKPYLRGKQVVLLGDGLSQEALLIQCARIKAAQFKSVWVLNGGAPQWAMGKAIGFSDGGVLPPITTLSATALWAESVFDANLVLSLRSSGLHAELPFAVTLPDWSDQSVRGALAAHKRAAKGGVVASVVLAQSPDDVAGAQRIDALRRLLFPLPVLVYKGAVTQLHAQLTQQQAMWRAHDRGPKQPRCGL
jgi:hypothetical protein